MPRNRLKLRIGGNRIPSDGNRIDFGGIGINLGGSRIISVWQASCFFYIFIPSIGLAPFLNWKSLLMR